MVPGTNPDIWITDLERLQQHLLECGKTIGDDEFVLNILYKISPEYESTAEKFLRLIEEGTKITYTKVRKSIKSKYKRLLLHGKVKEGKVHNHDSDEEDNDNDKALNTGSQPAFRKQFKGKCCNCGKIEQSDSGMYALVRV